MTLHQYVTEEPNWPYNAIGFRVGQGRMVWTGAYYPDGCRGHLVCVFRLVHEDGQTFTRKAYIDRDSKFQFVVTPAG